MMCLICRRHTNPLLHVPLALEYMERVVIIRLPQVSELGPNDFFFFSSLSPLLTIPPSQQKK